MQAKQTVKRDAEYENWVHRKWRPATAWVYLIICLFDFLIAPIVTFYFFGRYGYGNYTQWQPITLVGSGLFHISMGAVIGVTAWQRGEEKKYSSQHRYDYYEEYRPRTRLEKRVQDDEGFRPRGDQY